MMDLITSCTSLSLIAGIPSGLVFPGFPGFGISTSLVPIHSYLPCITASFISSIRVFVNSSIVPVSGPRVADPLFLLIFRYAANQTFSNLSSPLKSLNVLSGCS